MDDELWEYVTGGIAPMKGHRSWMTVYLRVHHKGRYAWVYQNFHKDDWAEFNQIDGAFGFVMDEMSTRLEEYLRGDREEG